MDTHVTLYHNPRCSKSRGALALLREAGVEPEIVEYLKNPPDPATIAALLERLGLEPLQAMRRGEAPFRELALGDGSHDRQALIEAMAAHPILIERPIAVAGKRAVIGRPPERVLALLDGETP